MLYRLGTKDRNYERRSGGGVSGPSARRLTDEPLARLTARREWWGASAAPKTCGGGANIDAGVTSTDCSGWQMSVVIAQCESAMTMP